MNKTCMYCGTPFEVDEKNHNELRRLYCSDDCRSLAWTEKARQRMAIGKRSYNVACDVCGKIFLTNRSTNKTCSKECNYEREKRMKRERWYRLKEERKTYKVLQPAVKTKQKKIETLTEVQRKAQEAGMTYGKYMEAQFIKAMSIERSNHESIF